MFHIVQFTELTNLQKLMKITTLSLGKLIIIVTLALCNRKCIGVAHVEL